MVAFISSIFLMISSTAQALQVQVTGFRSSEGYLAVSLFEEKEAGAFPDRAHKALRTFYIKVDNTDKMDVSIEDLPAGQYAIALMHDEDGDKKMKTNWVGIPREGFGFSQNPKVYFGAPSFKKAQFDSAQTTELSIRVRYF